MRVRVTKADIREGEAKDCYRCPIALALQRATGDPEANVYEHDWQIRLEAHCRAVVAPPTVAQWVHEFDDCGDGEPMTFDVPPVKEWREKCQHCGDLAAELDDDGYCEECRR